MAVNTEKNSYTVLFAVLMVIVVGSLLAFLASGLKPMIDENERFEKQQNILYAMGVNQNEGDGDVAFVPTTEVEDAFSKYITKQLVLEGTTAVEKENAYLINVEKALAKAKSGEKAELPLLIGEKDGEEYYIIPMYGKGLWDAIWGYISLDRNMEVKGVFLIIREKRLDWVPISTNAFLWTTLKANPLWMTILIKVLKWQKGTMIL